jgi:hypothetical protein
MAKLTTILQDPVQREAFVSQLKEWCLDFLMQFVPNLRIPTVTGEKDSLQYVIDHVVLSEFRVNSEDVHLSINPSTRQVSFTAQKMRFAVVGCRWRLVQKSFPHFSASGVADCSSRSLQLNLKCLIVTAQPCSPSESAPTTGGDASESMGVNSTQSTHTVVIETADVALSEMSLRVRGTIISPLANVATSLFADEIRKSIQEQLNKTLKKNSATLVKSLNEKIAKMMTMVGKNPLLSQAVQSLKPKATATVKQPPPLPQAYEANL